jgi:hypothetical protein
VVQDVAVQHEAAGEVLAEPAPRDGRPILIGEMHLGAWHVGERGDVVVATVGARRAQQLEVQQSLHRHVERVAGGPGHDLSAGCGSEKSQVPPPSQASPVRQSARLSRRRGRSNSVIVLRSIPLLPRAVSSRPMVNRCQGNWLNASRHSAYSTTTSAAPSQWTRGTALGAGYSHQLKARFIQGTNQ